jgi:hypothetical protein
VIGDTMVAAKDHPRVGGRRRIASLQPRGVAWLALLVLLIAAGTLLYASTRGATFWFDEWEWTINRRGDLPDAFLEPHNNHLSLIPIALYRLLYSTFGLDVYGPYRLMVIVAHLGCVVLLFSYASRRVGPFLGILAAASLLFLGPGWENIVWPFQVAWLISVGAGIGALLLLDRGDRRGDIGASILLGLALASSGLGLPLAIGIAVDVSWGRRRVRDLWIVGVPLVLYGFWWVIYQDSALRGELVDVPGFVIDAAAAAVSSVMGLAGDTVPRQRGTLLSWGRPLLAVAVVLFAWRLVRIGRIPPRVLTLLAIMVSFWCATELSRGPFSTPYESRYIYFGALFLLLLAVELARGVSVSWRAGLVLGAVVTAAVVSNIGILRDGAQLFRDQGQVTRSVLGAVELGRPALEPDHVIGLPGYPLLRITAQSYLAAERTDGTPAVAPAELAGQPEDARRQADRELVRIYRISLTPSSAGVRLGDRPRVDAVSAATVAARGACITLRPARGSPAGTLEVTLPPGGLRLASRGGSATMSVRRFADEWGAVGRVAPSVPAVLRITADRAARPWHARVDATEPVTVCGLA